MSWARALAGAVATAGLFVPLDLAIPAWADQAIEDLPALATRKPRKTPHHKTSDLKSDRLLAWLLAADAVEDRRAPDIVIPRSSDKGP